MSALAFADRTNVKRHELTHLVTKSEMFFGPLRPAAAAKE